MAEEKGFEPLRRLRGLSVFKTDPFNQTWVFLHLSHYLWQRINYSISLWKKSIFYMKLTSPASHTSIKKSSIKNFIIRWCLRSDLNRHEI